MSAVRVSHYDPDRSFGFVARNDERTWFHASDFHRIVPGGPEPILGERVSIETIPSGRVLVYRTVVPRTLRGRVIRFDPIRGWGFIEGEDGVRYFAHRKDADGPLREGTKVGFHAGSVEGKGPRACYIRARG